MRNPHGKSNSALIEEIHRLTGLPRAEIRWWFNRVVAAMRDRLKRGEPVNIRGLGTLFVHKRPARIVRWKKHSLVGERTSVQPESLHVRFRSSPTFNRQLNTQ